MVKLKSGIVALASVLVLGSAGFALYSVNQSNGDSKQAETSATSQQSTEPATKLTSSDDKKTVSYEGQTGKTALEVLDSLADVKTQESSYGAFVTSINGVTADGTTEFWSFYVNGKLASEGAGSYQSKDGESIEWKVEKVNQ